MDTKIYYSYKDYPDSARNLKYFIDNFDGAKAQVYISYNDDKYFNFGQLPENFHKIKLLDNIDISDWAYLIDSFPVEDSKYQILMNSSCIGPIVPQYFLNNWLEILIENLSDEIRVISPIIEFPPDNKGLGMIKEFKYINSEDKFIPFLHTFFVLMDRYAFSILTANCFFAKNIAKDEAIELYERGLTSILINEGIGVKSLMRVYRGLDPRDKKNWFPHLLEYGVGTCPEIPDNYFGANLNLYELMFYKNIRHKNKFRDDAKVGISSECSVYIENILNRKFRI